MSPRCIRRTTCRLCGARELTLALALEPTPPANAFVDDAARGTKQECFPLDLFFCETCTHLQLLDVVDPRLLFENYVYVSGTSPVFRRHFQDYADDLIERIPLQPNDLVVDIGSNDGTLLGFFKEAGCQAIGIDPARDIAVEATRSGIDTINAFFDADLARRLRTEHGPATAVTANNVFAHIDDLSDVVDGVHILLGQEGVFVFEVSYLTDVVEKNLFDTIYHEHVAYHAVKPLVGFFARRGMKLLEALRVDSHGGSLRGIASLIDGNNEVGSSVTKAIEVEEQLGINRPETYSRLGLRIDERKNALGKLLRELRASGKTIAGFGAPAKATTLLYHFDIRPKIIDFIVDDSPLKQGLFTPGMHIPVLSPQAIYERHPDYVLILAWNFAEPIMKNHAAFRQQGGHFVVPLPDVKVF